MAKEKTKSKYRYFKLGNEGATTFVDAKSGLKIFNDGVGRVLSRKVKNSPTLKTAMENNHVTEVDKAAYDKFIAAKEARLEAKENDEEDEDEVPEKKVGDKPEKPAVKSDKPAKPAKPGEEVKTPKSNKEGEDKEKKQ